jgi:hypothetical protein
MSFNSNGTYYPPAPEFPAIPGEIIYAEYFNTIIEDIADALSMVLPRDGRAGMTGDLPMGGNELKGLGGGTIDLPSVRFQSDSDTGVGQPRGEGTISIIVDGVEVIWANSTSVTIIGDTTFVNTVLVPPYLIQNAGVL